MLRPPPPQLALTMTGRPIFAGCIRSSVAVGQGVRRRNGWDVGGFRELARGDLVTQIDQCLGARADECDASGVCGGGQLGRFGKKAIAGVDGVGAGELRDADDFFDREIGRNRLHPHPDFVGFIGFEAVQGKAVFVGVNGDSLDAQFCCATEHTDGLQQMSSLRIGWEKVGWGPRAGPLRRSYVRSDTSEAWSLPTTYANEDDPCSLTRPRWCRQLVKRYKRFLSDHRLESRRDHRILSQYRHDASLTTPGSAPGWYAPSPTRSMIIGGAD